MRALQDIWEIIKLNIFKKYKSNSAQCISYYILLGQAALKVKKCLVAISHFHFSVIIAEAGHQHLLPPWLQVAWVMRGIRFPNYVWVRGMWGLDTLNMSDLSHVTSRASDLHLAEAVRQTNDCTITIHSMHLELDLRAVTEQSTFSASKESFKSTKLTVHWFMTWSSVGHLASPCHPLAIISTVSAIKLTRHQL